MNIKSFLLIDAYSSISLSLSSPLSLSLQAFQIIGVCVYVYVSSIQSLSWYWIKFFTRVFIVYYL